MTPVPSDAIKQLINQVVQGDVNGLKQLSQAERKALKSCLEHLNTDKTSIDQIDKGILSKISKPENYHQSPIRSLVKGIAKRLFNGYIDTNSLADFIRNNSSLILKNLEQVEKPGKMLQPEQSSSSPVPKNNSNSPSIQSSPLHSVSPSSQSGSKDVEALRQKILKMKSDEFPLFVYEELSKENPSTIVKLFDLHGASMEKELARLGGDAGKKEFIKELGDLSMPSGALSNIKKILLPNSASDIGHTSYKILDNDPVQGKINKYHPENYKTLDAIQVESLFKEEDTNKLLNGLPLPKSGFQQAYGQQKDMNTVSHVATQTFGSTRFDLINHTNLLVSLAPEPNGQFRLYVDNEPTEHMFTNDSCQLRISFWNDELHIGWRDRGVHGQIGEISDSIPDAVLNPSKSEPAKVLPQSSVQPKAPIAQSPKPTPVSSSSKPIPTGTQDIGYQDYKITNHDPLQDKVSMHHPANYVTSSNSKIKDLLKESDTQELLKSEKINGFAFDQIYGQQQDTKTFCHVATQKFGAVEFDLINRTNLLVHFVPDPGGFKLYVDNKPTSQVFTADSCQLVISAESEDKLSISWRDRGIDKEPGCTKVSIPESSKPPAPAKPPKSKVAPSVALDAGFALSPMKQFIKKPSGQPVPVNPTKAKQFKYNWGINPSTLPESTLNQQIASAKPEDLLNMSAKGIKVSGEQYLTAAEKYRSTIPAGGKERGPMLTTLHQLYSKAADTFENEGNLVKAFEARANASKFTLPSSGSALHNMSQAVGQGQAAQRNTSFPAHFAGLDTGILKGAALRASNRTIEGQEVTQLEFKLSKFARNDLQGHLLNIQGNLSAFEASLPPELQGKVRVTVVQDSFLGKKGDGSFGVTEGLTMFKAQAIQIEFEGVGSVIIGDSPHIGCLYNNVKVLVKAGLPEGKAQAQVHQMLTMLGVGPIMNEQRESDEERLKAALIFRTYFPKEATQMERSKEFYEMPVEMLKEKIVTKVPEMKSIFQKYEQQPNLIQKVETYPGKATFAITDLSQQMRAKGAFGLMAGVGTSDSVALIMKNGSLSSQDRFQAGLFTKGASSESDLKSGGGDGVFTRLINTETVKDDVTDFMFKGKFQMLYDLDVCNTGAYGFNNDLYGVKNPEDDTYENYVGRDSLLELAAKADLDSSNEMIVKNTIPPAMIRGIVCQSQAAKDELIAKLKAQGTIVDDKINGKPVDSFIHIADKFSGSMWDK